MGAVAKVLLSPVVALAGVLKKPKAPAAPVVPITPPQAQDRSSSVLAERIAARRGTQVNRRASGEALGGKKTMLGGGG